MSISWHGFSFSILDIILAFFLYVKMGRRRGVVAVIFFMLEIAPALFFDFELARSHGAVSVFDRPPFLRLFSFCSDFSIETSFGAQYHFSDHDL